MLHVTIGPPRRTTSAAAMVLAAAFAQSCTGSEGPCSVDRTDLIGFTEVDFREFDSDKDGAWSADECASFCERFDYAPGVACTYDTPPTDTAGGYGSVRCSRKYYTYEAYC